MIRRKEGENEIDFPAKRAEGCRPPGYGGGWDLGTSELPRDSQCGCTQGQEGVCGKG